MSRNLFSALIAVFLFYFPLRAQDLHYHHYTVDQGLPSSQVHDMVQDKYGRLWFSTDHGLACYDGYTFRRYTTADGLADNDVFKFFPQADGKIWCTTYSRKVFYFSGQQPVFTPYKYNEVLEKIPDYSISNSLVISDQGDLFMGFVSALGYIHINHQGQVVNNTVKLDEKKRPLWNLALRADKNDHLLFFYCFIGEEKEVTGDWKKNFDASCKNKVRTQLKAAYLPSNRSTVFVDNETINILSLGGDHLEIASPQEPISVGGFTDSLFWVGFRYGGLCIYDLHGKKIFSFLAGRSVTSLLVDHEGGYWISTLNDGVFHAKNTSVFSSNTDPEKDWIYSLAQDGQGRLWMGHYNGDITVREKGKHTDYYRASTGMPALVRQNANTGEVFFISDAQIHRSAGPWKTRPLNRGPIAMYIHGQDSVLVSGYAGVVSYHNEKNITWKTGRRVNDVYYHQQKLYVATNQGLYSMADQRLIYEGLKEYRIKDIERSKDQLVIATRGSGIIFWNGKKTLQVDQSKGLCANIVHRVCIENDSVTWACTNSGLSRLVVKNDQLLDIQTLTASDGLLSNEVSDVEVINDTVWVGTRQGLCYFPSAMLEQKKTDHPYYLNIAGLKVNDQFHRKPVDGLAYDENRIEFDFAGVSFSEFSPLRYRYQLQGLEQHWQYTGGRSALYASLPPNTYTFVLQAQRYPGQWSPPVKYTFTIHPPFWKTWWFITTAILLAVVLIYLFFRFRILSYNRDITRELLRQLLKRLKRKTNYVVFREQGKDIRIATETISYIKADGNYIEIHTDTKKYVVRYKIGEFIDLVPDPLEYLRINRSYIVRLDKIQEKSKKEVVVQGEKIAVGETYLDQLQKIKF